MSKTYSERVCGWLRLRAPWQRKLRNPAFACVDSRSDERRKPRSIFSKALNTSSTHLLRGFRTVFRLPSSHTNPDLHPQYFAGQFSLVFSGIAVMGDQLQFFFCQIYCIPAGDDPAGKIGAGGLVYDPGFRTGLSQELF